MSTFYAILTEAGEAKIANAHALGETLLITHMAVGDGNGAPTTPDTSQTALVNERRRAQLNTLNVDPQNPSAIIAEQVIPESVGGWWIRELGLFDEDGDLVAVANCPDTYKPVLAEGSGRTQVIRMVLIVSSASAVELKIDPAVVLATRQYVDNALLNFAPVYSILALPTQNIGPIIVAEADEVWTWQETAYFSGYRHVNCGRPVWGHTLSPLDTEVDAVGGLVPKADYAALWGYAQENGLVVPQATWEEEIGAHFFVDADATHFRLPDLRNQFARWAAGANDIDTANVRPLGSRQLDALQNITANIWPRGNAGPNGGAVSGANGAAGFTKNGGPSTGNLVAYDSGTGQLDLVYFDASRVARTSAETRAANTGYCPRLHV